MKIGILGKRRTGKDTLAGILREYQPGLRVASFAAPLKHDVLTALHHAASVLPPIYSRAISQAVGDRNIMGPLWQWWGTELMRAYDSDYWLRRFDNETEGYEHVVVTDCRFINEAQYLRENGYTLVKIIGTQRIPDGDNRSDAHSSETELDHITADLVVYNLGNIDLLRLWVEDNLPRLRA